MRTQKVVFRMQASKVLGHLNSFENIPKEYTPVNRQINLETLCQTCGKIDLGGIYYANYMKIASQTTQK